MTRPPSWRGLDVPDVLLGGDHGAVERWRHTQSLRRTAERRPDMLPPSALVGADTVAGEAVFVPSAATDRAEDDGWLLTITTRRDGSASQLLVLDATDVGGRPVAAVTLPRGVPSGFHGSWITDEEIGVR